MSVTWNEIPEQNRMGVIQGYNLTVKSSLHRITVKVSNLSTEVKNLLKGILYEVTVAAFNGGGQGPTSSAFEVQREEEGEKQDTQSEALVNKG